MSRTEPAADASDTLPARIAASLADRIIRGDLKPGDRVRQDQVAADFAASHVPVREAFRRLEARGLLVSEARKGVHVALLDRASLVEITHMREALEGLALNEAIPHLSAADFTQAEQAIRAAGQSQDMAVWEDANRRFHLALYQPCGMPRVLREIQTLHEARLRYMYATATLIDWNPGSQDEHQALLDAARAGDTVGAGAILTQHIAASGALLAAALEALR